MGKCVKYAEIKLDYVDKLQTIKTLSECTKQPSPMLFVPLWHIEPSQSFSTPLDWLLWSAPPPMTSNLPLAFLSLLYVMLYLGCISGLISPETSCWLWLPCIINSLLRGTATVPL